MRVAVVQFAPKIGRVQENIHVAQKLCEKLKPKSVDLVCLPEMIFTGYVFPDASSISPYLEEPGAGPTSRFCAELAARLQCYVAAGYPERLAPSEQEAATKTASGKLAKVGANSAVLYGPDGALVGQYRKSNLYETDMTWAKAGTEFVTFHLPKPLKTVTLAICMDLNPRPGATWTLEDGPYELADYCKAQKTDTLILLNAWLYSRDRDRENDEDDGDWATIRYWAARLRPLWQKPSGHEAANQQLTYRRETLVVICNRCGTENGITFAGSSSLFRMRGGCGKPDLLHYMEQDEEDVGVWNI
ncbi:hydrolase [Wolfiporia cocos MD-104 SS10]|uniref:Hydrolase n=1 Tax=Wolfiporia cocos (strain MD-104) TaxID=742152 RepID=A0A2H3JDF8_WOLCO|nr:hydrolase [Wolfiporia cocos MD-104 SS10]